MSQARSFALLAICLLVACGFSASNNPTDAGPPPTVGFTSASSPMVDEKSGKVEIPVVMSAASSEPVTVRYSAGGSATAGTDFQLEGVGLGFLPGETQKTITVEITNDMLMESSESIVLTLESANNADLGIATHTIQISADILPRVTFMAATSMAAESAATKLDVSLDMAFTREVRVDYSLAGTAFAILDYELASGTLVFAPGETKHQLSLEEVNDQLDEDPETVIVNLTNPVETILGAIPTTTHTIEDNDAEPTVGFTATTNSQTEATANATATVTLSAPSGRVVAVDYSQVGGTASVDDVTITASTLVFIPGETSKLVPITIAEDALDEDDETAPVQLMSPLNATLAAAVHTLTVLDNDAMPTVSFTAASQTSVESGTVTLTVQLSAPSGRAVSVPYSAASSSTATSPADYSYPTASPLSFPAGATQRTIAIDLVADTMDEIDEQLITALGTPTNATPGATPSHTLTITDDDAPPSVMFDPTQMNGSANEGNSGMTPFDYRVVLSAPSGKTVSFAMDFDGDADNPEDYTLRNSDHPVVFDPGQTVKMIRLNIVGDTVSQGGNDTIEMRIPATITNGTQGTPSLRTHLIVDDD